MSLLDELRASSVVAKNYENRGYAVSIEPDPSTVPFDLLGYRPDLLATRVGEHVIVEVRAAGHRSEPARLRRVAEIVEAHPNWKFEIVTLPDLALADVSELPARTLEDIRALVARVDTLLAQPALADLSFLPLWSAYLSTLRLSVADHIESGRPISDLSLLNQSYSLGVISFDSLSDAKRLLRLRNEAAHGLAVGVAAEDVSELRQMVGQVLADAAGARDGEGAER